MVSVRQQSREETKENAMDMEKLVALCRRKGFIFQSSEIYGGINGFWDYGPLGVELKKNVKEAWWQDMVRNPPLGPDGHEISMVGVDCALIMNPKVWVASGHVGGFADPMVDCKKCRRRFRADKVWLVAFQESVVDLTSLAPAGISPEAKDTIAPLIQQKARQPKLVIPVEADSGTEAIKVQLSKAQLKQFKSEPMPPEASPLFSAPVEWPRRCPACQEGELTEARAFNLMFQTYVGAVQDEANIAYLRPETAQGIFVNFRNVLDSTRLKLPFGIAQVGKAFRNEINPRNYTFRSREFEQMEIEFFCHPSESMKWYQYWRDVRKKWYTQLGIKSDRLRPREQGKEELAHYSIGTTDIEYMFPFSDEPQELEGVAHRGEYDLRQHQTHSGKDLSYFDEELWAKADKSAYGGDKKKEQAAKSGPPYRFLPHVIEPSAGADRFTLAVLCEAYTEDKVPDASGKEEERIVMKFHPRLAPIKAAILPLVNKEGMPEVAEKLYRELKREFNVFFDDGGAVGRRYRRQDEAGTPYCFTIDGQTLQDQTVTIRDRDTLEQRRLPIAGVADHLRKLLQPQA
jgi:glycyl-tRNA synthetase